MVRQDLHSSQAETERKNDSQKEILYTFTHEIGFFLGFIIASGYYLTFRFAFPFCLPLSPLFRFNLHIPIHSKPKLTLHSYITPSPLIG